MFVETFSQPLAKVVSALCEDTNTPRALTVAILLRNNEFGQLFSLKIDPQHYLSSNQYFKDCQVTELLRKLELDVPGIDRRAVALEGFYSSEKQCGATNARLSRFVCNGPFGPADVRLFNLVDEMKRDMKSILGALPKSLSGRFGPGATFEDKGQLTTVPDKMTSRPTITEGACCLLGYWHETAWFRAIAGDPSLKVHPSIVRGNRFTTVPKDATKDRGICVEASLNVWFQLSVGKLLKARLHRAGIDLLHAQPLHQSLAREASRSGSHATIDLSNASDTMSYQLVKLLLPEEWFDLLDSLRSPMTRVNGKWVRLEKFSSMGNGFTFELETLVFLVLVRAIASLRGKEYQTGKDLMVFGDDIIVPTDIAEDAIAGLKWIGFTPNSRKTFLSGPFRESCGGDFFQGEAVRPHYQKKVPYEPQHWISLANGLRNVGRLDSRSDVHREYFRRAWLRALDALPSHIRRLRGPIHLGDLVIHDDTFQRRWRSGIGYVRVYRPVARPLSWSHWKPSVMYASALYGIPSKGPLPRGSVEGYKVGWVAFS